MKEEINIENKCGRRTQPNIVSNVLAKSSRIWETLFVVFIILNRTGFSLTHHKKL